MAGILPGFNADKFRTGIRTAMMLGLPVEEERRPQFVLLTDPVTPGVVDAEGVPWDIDDEMVPDTEVKVRVLCAIEQFERSEETQKFGRLQPGYIELTLLDEEYALIEGFTYVNLWPTNDLDSPVKYLYRRVLMQPSMDIVGVWVLECATEDAI